jgi:hypothetical protein
MSWTIPTIRATGDLITSSIYNTDLVNNLKEVWHEIAYVEFTSNQTTTATSFAAGTQIVSAGSLVFDGTRPIRVEVFAPVMFSSSTGSSVQVSLADGGTAGTDLGLFQATGSTQAVPLIGLREFTPPSATKTYSAVIWQSAAGTGTVQAGTGGTAGARLPGFIRITTKG